MKAILAFIVLVLILTGCGNSSNKPNPNASTWNTAKWDSGKWEK